MLLFCLSQGLVGNKTRRIVKSLGFGHCELVDARGFAGRIWFLWNNTELDVKIIEKHEQYVHVCFNLGKKDEWFFTAVYACLKEEGRVVLWENIKRIAEQKGGARVNVLKCNSFRSHIYDWGLLNLEMKGLWFTGKGPKWRGYDRLVKKLD